MALLMHGNRISGTIPTQVGQLTQLGRLDTGISQMGLLVPPTYDLDGPEGIMMSGQYTGWRMGQTPSPDHPHDNAISGTIPSSLALLNVSLEIWHADGLRLSGTLPAELDAALIAERALNLANLDRAADENDNTALFLSEIDLRGNRLGPFAADEPISVHCMTAGISCQGMPPQGCSAMGPAFRLSLTETGTCIQCPPLGATLGLLALVLALWVAAMGVLYKINHMTQKAKKAMRTIFATASIVIGQVQIIYIFTDLKAVEDSAAADVAGLAAAAFADPSILRIECLSPSGLEGGVTDMGSPQTISKLGVLGLPVLTFAGLLGARFWHGPVRGNLAAADKFARLTLIFFMLQLSFVTSQSLGMLVDTALERNSSPFEPLIGLALILLELLYAVRLWRDARGLRIGKRGGSASAAADIERRASRLEPLTEKYASHAPYWQFVVWGRTLALIVLETVITPEVVPPPAHAYAQTVGAAIVILVSLGLQLRFSPFGEEVLPGVSQNRLEAGLLANNVVQLITAAVYNSLRGGSGSGSMVADSILCVLFFAPAVVMLVLLLRSRRLRRALTGRTSRLSGAAAAAPTKLSRDDEEDADKFSA
jgi:hypothetical protein